MALPDFARNVFGPAQQGDLSLVTFVITATQSIVCPGCTISAGVNGVYTCTMPSGAFRVCLSRETVNAAAKTVTVTALSTTAGVTTFTLTFSGNANPATTEEAHVAFLVGNP